MKLGTIFGAAALCLVGAGACTALTQSYTYSEGARIGTVPKFSNKGLIFKTWEGELAQQTFTQHNGALSNTFTFSAQDSKVIEALETARDNGSTVKLQYKQTLSHLPWDRDTDYLIVEVKPVTLDQPVPGNPLVPR